MHKFYIILFRKIGTSPRINFDNFTASLEAVFIIMTTNTWNGKNEKLINYNFN